MCLLSFARGKGKNVLQKRASTKRKEKQLKIEEKINISRKIRVDKD